MSHYIMEQKFEICPNKRVGSEEPCFIIAEIGQNHQGDILIAKDLIRKAKVGIDWHWESGADCVKFQKSDLKTKFNAAALARPYLGENSWGTTYGNHKSFLEFSESQFRDLQQFANGIGIPFTASAMDEVSLSLLHAMDVPFIKIGSGDANNYELLRKAATTGRPIVLSTGMQEMKSVEGAVKLILDEQEVPRLCLLQCTSCYPTPPDQVHLKVIRTLQEKFKDVHVGYSGHERGYAISLAAAALGARVIERHITLDKNAKGSDHMCSLEPEEFKCFVDGVREIEAALGSAEKRCLPCEQPVVAKLGKTLVVTQDLPMGTIISHEHLTAKVAEPRGIETGNMGDVIGKKLLKDLKCDESLLPSHFIP